MSAAREVALTKPIIVIKAGRSEAASRAAASHTGALTGSDEVLEAAFRRSGVLRVHNISDLFYMAEVLGRQPRPKGPRLTILTNAGGPAVLATDALVASGGELAELSPETLRRLNEFCPPTGVTAILSMFSPIPIPSAMLAPSKLLRRTRTAMACWSSSSRKEWPILCWLPKASSLMPKDMASPCSPVGWEEQHCRRRSRTEFGGHSNVSLSRHGGAGFHAHVALQLQSARTLRDSRAG